MESIYGEYKDNLIDIMMYFKNLMDEYNDNVYKSDHTKMFEHISYRIKSIKNL